MLIDRNYHIMAGPAAHGQHNKVHLLAVCTILVHEAPATCQTGPVHSTTSLNTVVLHAASQTGQARRRRCEGQAQDRQRCGCARHNAAPGTMQRIPHELTSLRPTAEQSCAHTTEGGRAPIRSGQNAVAAGRLQRQNETKQLRERKRSQSLAQRRREGPPIVVAFLPLSADVDASGLWQLVLGAFAGGSKPGAEPKAKKGAPEPMEEDPQPLNGASAFLSFSVKLLVGTGTWTRWWAELIREREVLLSLT